MIEMKLNFVWLMTMLGLLFFANVLMALGYGNQQSSMEEAFIENFTNPTLSPAPSLASGEYIAIGTYDNLEKKPEHGQSTWRGPAPNEPLTGPEVQIDDDHLYMFANNQSKPECCPSSYTSSTGCVCTTPGQRDLLGKRGGNHTIGAGE
jgi:hypothetical protein